MPQISCVFANCLHRQNKGRTVSQPRLRRAREGGRERIRERQREKKRERGGERDECGGRAPRTRREKKTNRKKELRGKKRGPAAKNGGHQPKRNRKNQQRGGAAAHCVPLLPYSRLALSLSPDLQRAHLRALITRANRIKLKVGANCLTLVMLDISGRFGRRLRSFATDRWTRSHSESASPSST